MQIYNYYFNKQIFMAGIAKLQLLIDIKEKLNVGLNKARQKVNKAVNGMQQKLNSIKIDTTKAFGAIKDEVPGIARAVTLISNPYILAAAAAVGLGAAIASCTAKANKWHEQMAEINVTAELSKDKLGKLSDKLLEIGARNVAPLEDVPKAFSKIISAGLSVNDSLATLEPTLRAAKAGFTDVETTAGTATSLMMSTGYEAGRVFDILFETVKEGNAGFKDIGQYLPKIVPLAKNVGYELEEVAGTYAMLTGRLSAEQSTTALQGVMRALSSQRTAIGQIDKETGKYVSGFKSIGIDVFDPVTKKIKPIVDIVEELNKKMAGLSDKERMLQFDKIGLDQTGGLGLSTLMQDVPALQKAIDATINSAGSLEKAYTDALSPMDDWKITMNQLKVHMIHIGEMFLPTLSAIGKGALFIAQNLDIIGGVLAGLTVAWTILNAKLVAQTAATLALKAATAIATVAQWAFNVAANANPIGLIVLAIGALIGGLVMAYKKFDNFRAIIQGSWEVIKGFGNILKDFVIDRIKGLLSGLGSIGSAISKLFRGDFKGAWDDTKKGVVEISGINALRDAVDKTKGLKNDFTNKYNSVLAQSKKNESGDFAGVPSEITDETKKNNDDTDKTKDNSSITDGAKGIKGNSQTKNITINIDSFIKGFTPTHQSFNSMSMDEIERKMTEVFLRVVRSAETSM
jgi:TP901 family phage tail tape measure protein